MSSKQAKVSLQIISSNMTLLHFGGQNLPLQCPCCDSAIPCFSRCKPLTDQDLQGSVDPNRELYGFPTFSKCEPCMEFLPFEDTVCILPLVLVNLSGDPTNREVSVKNENLPQIPAGYNRWKTLFVQTLVNNVKVFYFSIFINLLRIAEIYIFIYLFLYTDAHMNFSFEITPPNGPLRALGS